MKNKMTIDKPRVGQIEPFGPKQRPSAIHKYPVEGPVKVNSTGLSGDDQGDKKNHGGLEKAVHAYPALHYEKWNAELTDLEREIQPGDFGENLIIHGMEEKDICIGDQWQIGSTLFEVSQARQPCWKLNVRFNRRDMSVLVQQTGRTGWYFRVLSEGIIGEGDEVLLKERPHPTWSLQRVHDLLYRNVMDVEALKEFSQLPQLSKSWKDLAVRRLKVNQVEDWSSRLETPVE